MVPGFCSLPHSVFGAQIHTVGNILHGPKFKEQPQVQSRQNKKTERTKNNTTLFQWNIHIQGKHIIYLLYVIIRHHRS